MHSMIGNKLVLFVNYSLYLKNEWFNSFAISAHLPALLVNKRGILSEESGCGSKHGKVQREKDVGNN